MVDIHIDYRGGLRCTATHGPSKNELITDAPVDNHGKGESFSPTDLVATALGTCMLTVMGIFANKNALSIDGLSIHVKKYMTAQPPRRIARLQVTMTAPEGLSLSESQRADLEKVAETCPVRLSLLDAIDVPIEFRW